MIAHIVKVARRPLPLIAWLFACGGCASPFPKWPAMPAWTLGAWTAGYEEAERAARASGRGLLVYYRTSDQSRHDAMFDALRSREIKQRTIDLVTCMLFHAYEPHRRFVGQYGVERAPALILIHCDGTYHVQSGPRSAEQIAQFLDRAAPPGETPARNAHLSRQPAYAWHGSLEAAQQAADRSGQSVLLVLDRWHSRDWERLRPMLERCEVYARFADMIHCRPSSFWGGTEAARRKFGVANLPALVIIRADGSFESLELPNSYESIARFADAARSRSSVAGNSSMSATE